MKCMSETLFKEMQIFPVTNIGDIEIELVGIEGFTLSSKDTEKIEKNAMTIPSEVLYLLMKGLLLILKREPYDNKDISNSYDVSCDFDEYFFRINVKEKTITLKYWESTLKKDEFETVISFDIKYGNDIANAIISMCEEDIAIEKISESMFSTL